MKLELPLAMVLLAAGCLLWNAQRTKPIPQKNDASVNRDGAFEIARASYQQDANSSFGGAASDLLRQSAANLLGSAPIQAKAKMFVNLFGQEVIATGSYFQQGQGSERSRFELQQGTGDDAIKVMQLFDGRFVYTRQTIASETSLTYVDLHRVEETSSRKVGFLGTSDSLLSTGSISSLMKNLSAAFDFSTPQPTELGGIEMVTCRGTWKPDVLKKVLVDLVEPRIIQGDIDWKSVPAQIPHTVEITLGNDQYLPLFPYRIVFFRTNSDGNDQQILRLDLFEVGKLNEIPEEIFNIDSADLQPQDATPEYVQRVLRYQEKFELQQAGQPTGSELR